MKLHNERGGRFQMPHKQQKPRIGHLPVWNKQQRSRLLSQSPLLPETVVQNPILDDAWNQVQMALRNRDSWEIFESLLSIVKFLEDSNQNRFFMDDCATHLRFLIELEVAMGSLVIVNANVDVVDNGAERETLTRENFNRILDEAVIFCGSGDRHSTMLKKLIQYARNDQQSLSISAPESIDGKHSMTLLTQRESKMVEKLWVDFEKHILCRNITEAFLVLYQIVVMWDRKNYQWMPRVREKLNSILQRENQKYAHTKFRVSMTKELLKCCEDANNRHTYLIRKLLKKLDQNDVDQIIAHSNTRRGKSKSRKNEVLPSHYDTILQSLRDDFLENNNIPSWILLKKPYLPSKLENKHLSLPQPPTWISSTIGVCSLVTKMSEMHISQSSFPVQLDNMIAFDSEWYTTTGSDPKLSTIQFGMLQHDGIPHAWVVDLKQHSNTITHPINDSTTPEATRAASNAVGDEDLHSEEHCEYSTAIRRMLTWLFLESDINLIGFACHHDLHMISSYIGEEISVSSTRFVDVQLLAANEMMASQNNVDCADDDGDHLHKISSSSLPGLKSCCSYFQVKSDSDYHIQPKEKREPWTLSKSEQCSDWSRRPLSSDQLEYAGLDAVVLLVLLAEIIR